MNESVERLQAENKRLRAALEQYADPKNWFCTKHGQSWHDCHDPQDSCCYAEFDCAENHGYKLAQAALRKAVGG